MFYFIVITQLTMLFYYLSMFKVLSILLIVFPLVFLYSSSASPRISSINWSLIGYWISILCILSNGVLIEAVDPSTTKARSTRLPQPSTSRRGCDHISFPSDNIYVPRCTQCHSRYKGPAPMGVLDCDMPAILHSIMLSHIYATQVNAIMHRYLNSRPYNYVGSTIPSKRFRNTALSMERYNRYYSSNRCFRRGAYPTTKYDQDRSNPYTDPRRASCTEPDVYARLRRYLDCSPLIHSNGITSASQLTIDNVAKHNSKKPLNNKPEPFVESSINDDITDVHVARAYSVDQYQVTTTPTTTTTSSPEQDPDFAFLQDDSGSVCALSVEEVKYLENVAPFNMDSNVRVVNSLSIDNNQELNTVIDLDTGELRSNLNIIRTHYVDSININNVEPVDLYNSTELLDVQYGDAEFFQHRRKRSPKIFYCQCNDYSYADASLILLDTHVSVTSKYDTQPSSRYSVKDELFV